jgi:hypothetical protein
MGQTIYVNWYGMTDDDRKNQYAEGYKGVLHEVYAPQVGYFATDAFIWGKEGTSVLAQLLRQQLPLARKLLGLRRFEMCRQGYIKSSSVPEDDPTWQSILAFVEFAEQKERETGKPITIHAYR